MSRSLSENYLRIIQEFDVFFFKSSIIKPTVLNTNEQKAIGGTVEDPAACVVSMPVKTLDLTVEYVFQLKAYI